MNAKLLELLPDSPEGFKSDNLDNILWVARLIAEREPNRSPDFNHLCEILRRACELYWKRALPNN